MNIAENGVYKYKTTGSLYTVLNRAILEATQEMVVIYQRTNSEELPCVMVQSEFKEKFARSDVNKPAKGE